MSANLDKGLDEIIAGKGGKGGSSNRRTLSSKKAEKPKSSRGFKKAGAGSSTKTLGKAMAAAAAGKNGKHQSVALSANPLEAARRAVVSHLPADVSAEDARGFFASRVGRIRQVTGGFRQDGRPSGEFTLTFDAPGKALELMNKFNGQPIDGGKSKLAVQILLDANVAQAPKPLSERIGKLPQLPQQPAVAANDKKKKRYNNSNSNSNNSGNNNRKRTGPKTNDLPKPAKSEPVKAARSKAKNNKSQQPRKVRTAADLDAEMSDYFAAADKNEISV